jgi:protein TonB
MTAWRMRDVGAFVLTAVVASLLCSSPVALGQEAGAPGPAPASRASQAPQDLSRAKELYLSAAYDEALTLLDGLNEDSAAGSAIEVAQYRVFCLMALGRGDEAKKAIEGMVAMDPFYRLPDSQTPPRIRTAYQDARRTMLPALVQRRYAEAKAAFDEKDPRAAEHFDRVLTLLDDPDLKGSQTFTDLRTVAVGFRDLAKAAAPPPAPAPAPAPPPSPAPAAEVVAAPRRAALDIVPPVVIFQPMPQWTPAPQDRGRTFNGSVVVLVNDQGGVDSVAIEKSIHPQYDRQLLRIARTWKFKPATRNGVPTEFERSVEIQLKPNP